MSSRNRRRLLILTLLIGLCVLIMTGSVFVGAVRTSELEPAQAREVLLQLRLPRILLAALVGAALAVSGALLQAMFRNPMADPYLLGISSGGALGASVGMLVESMLPITAPIIPLFAGAAAIATIWCVYLIAKTGGRLHPTTLLLTGIAVSTLLMAAMTFVVIQSANDQTTLFMRMYSWMLGGFHSGIGIEKPFVAAPYIFVCILMSIVFAHPLNVLMVGDETAHSLGVNVEQMRRIVLLVSSLLGAAAVSVAGIIGFVGLIAPHAVRMMIGPDHRWLIPGCALFGATFLIICDTLARASQPPTEFPVGVFSALFGVPFFLYLLKRTRRVYL